MWKNKGTKKRKIKE